MNWMDITLLSSLGVSWLALAAALLALARGRRQAQQLQTLQLRLQRDLNLANSGAMGMGQRLLALEKRLASSAAKTAPGGYEEEYALPFSQATDLFAAGLDADEVARRCGLSRAEASLLEAMQRQAANYA